MRLCRSRPGGDGIRRVRRGRGFSYHLPDGSRPSAADLRRIDELAIPPAWRDVWICARPNGHIQAVGTDAAGRRQYLYHERWRRERDEEKHDRALALAQRLAGLRERVHADLRLRGCPRRRVEAVALRIVDLGVFRIGGEEYAEENGTHGAATLLRSQVRVRGDIVGFDFPAKGGARRRVDIPDHDLAVAVRVLLRARHDMPRLLVCRTGRQWHELHADDVNARFREIAGLDCSAKDIRTWHATALAAAAYAGRPVPQTQRRRRAVSAEVMAEVANALGNTPAVARASYVDPRIVAAYTAGELAPGSRAARALARAAHQPTHDARSNAVDRAVRRLLRDA